MRVVVALGGNALLRRGQPMTIETQRVNVGVACDRLAPIAERHELVVSHGNGPQIGLLALEEAAYEAAAGFSARRVGRGNAGNDRLSGGAGAREPAAVREAVGLVVDDDRGRPGRSGVRESDEADRADVHRLPRRKSWRPIGAGRSSRTGTSMRRVVPSPAPQRIFERRPIGWLLERGCVVICAGGGGIPTAYRVRARTGGRRGGDRQGSRQRAVGSRHRRRRADSRDRCAGRVRAFRSAGSARDPAGRIRTRSNANTAPSSPSGRCCRRSWRRVTSLVPTGKPATIGALDRHRGDARRHRGHTRVDRACESIEFGSPDPR